MTAASPTRSLPVLPALLCPDVALASWQDRTPERPQAERTITIRTARRRQDDDTPEQRLLGRRYAWRGYRSVTLPADQTGYRTTLTAQRGDEVLGTLTLALDGGPQGLPADGAFPEVMAELRAQGRRIVEFTRLSVEADGSSRRVLGGLFHVGFIVAHRLRAYDTLLLEVNPRHRRFYERVFGCRVIASPREHAGVGAPAVLMTADFATIHPLVVAFANGSADRVSDGHHMAESNVYPNAMTESDEDGILKRLMQAQQPASMQAS